MPSGLPRPGRVVVVGAGIGGLAAGALLAARGLRVTLLEQQAAPGGKLRPAEVDGERIDAGPTVLTMRWALEAIFEQAGARLDEHLELRPASVLASHAWPDGGRLDLHADLARSAEAIGEFAGAGEARRFLAFSERARLAYEALERSFIRTPCPSLLRVALSAGSPLSGMRRISPFRTLWSQLEREFGDPRLRQLFGRYATYCGGSPFAAPATLMLVAHVERQGVWLVTGGMHRLASALAALAIRHGAELRCGCAVTQVLLEDGRASGVQLATGERLEADSVVLNADVAALSRGWFGAAASRAVPPVPPSRRSLSAITWTLRARASGFPLTRHNVFFSPDSREEFGVLERGGLPATPTTYVCAQDRDAGGPGPDGRERLLCLVNAPALGDLRPLSEQELDSCERRTFAHLERCGLKLEPGTTIRTAPADFERRYPGTGGGLYGEAPRGWTSSFRRPGVKSRLPGLYLAGGSTHPGPGVPMAALSGTMAAESVLQDLVSTSRFRRAATSGGTSMP